LRRGTGIIVVSPVLFALPGHYATRPNTRRHRHAIKLKKVQT
jgi:hypothetical protein